MDGPRDKVEVVDYLVLPLPFPLSVPLPSVRRESGGLASGSVSLPFRLPLPLPLPFPCPFLFPWEVGGSRRRNQRVGERGYVIPPGGEVVQGADDRREATRRWLW